MNKFFIIITLFLSLCLNLSANPNLKARTGILVDYHSDDILFELDPDAQIYPASMTKIMTSIVAFDLLKKNQLSLDDKFMRRFIKFVPSSMNSIYLSSSFSSKI